MDWDPSVVDNDLELDQWLDAQMELDNLPGVNNYWQKVKRTESAVFYYG